MGNPSNMGIMERMKNLRIMGRKELMRIMKNMKNMKSMETLEAL